jgi:D-glycero-alpha-D-manno-heptose-7-phosphate kinase
VDGLYSAARAAGALGGKITGAGGGGFLLLFAPPHLHAKIKAALNKLIHVPFSFDYSGSQIIYFQHEEDYSHAEKERGGQIIAPFRELNHPGFSEPHRALAAMTA